MTYIQDKTEDQVTEDYLSKRDYTTFSKRKNSRKRIVERDWEEDKPVEKGYNNYNGDMGWDSECVFV